MDFRGKRLFFNFIGTILTLALIFASFFAVVNVCFNLVYIKTRVKEFSMYPALNSGVMYADEFGDHVYINRYENLARGRIVVANVKWKGDETYVIKRLVAVPGDEFRIAEENGEYAVYVNDQLFYTKPKMMQYPEKGELVIHPTTASHYETFLSYLQNNKEDETRVVKKDGQPYAIKLKADEYLLVGDNWANSMDNLSEINSLPFTKSKEILGCVDIIIDVNDNPYLVLFKNMIKRIFSI